MGSIQNMLTCSCDQIGVAGQDWWLGASCAWVWRWGREVDIVQLIVVSLLIIDNDVLVDILIDRQLVLISWQAGRELGPGQLGQLD